MSQRHNKNIRHTHRIFVPTPLGEGATIATSAEQSHYLQNVLRMKSGDELRLFNGADGEYLGLAERFEKKSVHITLSKQLRAQQEEPKLYLYCAPIKKNHFDYMVEKATELGVCAITPVITQRTQIREVNTERMQSICIEAAEQSERLNVPRACPPVTIAELIKNFPDDRALIVCAETGEAEHILHALDSEHAQSFDKAAILTGPEGGFAEEELEALKKHPNAIFVRLGARILRADTAAIAALSCWQAHSGDWYSQASIK